MRWLMTDILLRHSWCLSQAVKRVEVICNLMYADISRASIYTLEKDMGGGPSRATFEPAAGIASPASHGSEIQEETYGATRADPHQNRDSQSRVRGFFERGDRQT